MWSVKYLLVLMMTFQRLSCFNTKSTNHTRNFPVRARKNVTQISTPNPIDLNTTVIDRSGTMIFPDASSKEPKGQCYFGMCDKIDNYPSNEIERILEKSPDFRQYLIPRVQIDNRDQFGLDDDDTMCATSKFTRFPESAKNTRNEEKIIVKSKDHIQGFETVLCKNEGTACRFSAFFPNYEATCTQKFAVRRLMVYEKNKENFVFDDFQIPSCCVCTVRVKAR
ncbi:neurotrophin 1 isoform X2 [Aethina tumida]|uniref:neurotrophin 1 isoform X2 n=1 Tax=Aethina tumida TaxID=116153 RepID=UPI00096ADED4|nr:neurotrophin 1 isoform X2 [Aethina tumida]